MPTTTQMLEKAEALEALAKAIRMTIAAMNGDLTERKEKRVGTVIEEALALRREQRGQGEPAPRATRATLDSRVARIRTFLAEGPKKTQDVQEYLAGHGDDVPLSRDRVRQMLQEMPDTTQVGKTAKARWSLNGSAERPIAARPASQPKPKKRPHKPAPNAAQVKENRVFSAQLLEKFPRGTVVTTKDLHDIGVDLAGVRKLGGLFRHGYLKRKGEGWVRTSKPFTP